ncbi:hypothetical protein N7493_003516 [Penicillium malachiteum]|uniref:Uncharacterized protein n=1 Tax=Penicillium malachiteum TaxID=1324776 RepID=A0AAD6MXN8_9EURO|nr:hypothetical protein N7493_003516 [Penicillium malachiteum]
MRRAPFGRLMSSRINPRNEPAADESPSSEPENDPQNEVFFPGVWDVLKVRYLLQWKLQEGFPPELIDEIIDEAEYWPSTENRMEGKMPKWISQDHDQVLLKTVPLCYDRKSLEQSSSPKPLPHRGIRPVRKIIFKITSHDQGGRGTITDEDRYRGTWTWFDTEVIHKAHTRNMYADGKEQELLENERGDKPRNFGPGDEGLLPRDYKLQVNARHCRTVQNHTIVWHCRDCIGPESHEAYYIERKEGRGRLTLDGRYVRELEIGDSIALWAKARFPGWVNNVYKASVRVFWAV